MPVKGIVNATTGFPFCRIRGNRVRMGLIIKNRGKKSTRRRNGSELFMNRETPIRIVACGLPPSACAENPFC